MLFVRKFTRVIQWPLTGVVVLAIVLTGGATALPLAQAAPTPVAAPVACSAAPTITVASTGDITSQLSTLFPSNSGTTQRVVKFPAGSYQLSGAVSAWTHGNTVIQATGATISMATAGRNLLVPQDGTLTVCGGTWVGNGQAVLRANGVNNVTLNAVTFQGGTSGAVFEGGSTGNAITNSTFTKNSSAGLTVQTGASASVTASTMDGNTGHGAQVIGVGSQLALTGSDLSSNTNSGLAITTRGTVTATGNNTVNNNGQYGVVADSGATLTMTDAVISGNGASTAKNGITVSAASTVNLTRVTSTKSGSLGLAISGASTVTAVNSNFDTNTNGGIWAQDSGTSLTLTGTSASNNGINGVQSAAYALITLNANNTLNGNKTGYGLFVGASSNPAIGNVKVNVNGTGNTFSSNGRQGIGISNGSSLTATAPITANSNVGSGLTIDTGSSISATDLTASNNGGYGLYMDAATVSVSGTATLSNNGRQGLMATNGTATFDAITAIGNQTWGVFASTGSTVTVKSCLNASGNLQGQYRAYDTGVLNANTACGSPAPVPVSSVTVLPAQSYVGVKGSVALSATVIPDYATNKALTWTSSNTAYATVSATGVVTGKAVGTVTITANAKDGSGKSATASVTVLATCSTFSDVDPSQNQFAPYICWMSVNKITTGMTPTTYVPKGDVTREAMAAFLYRLAGSPTYTPPAKPTFSDVSNDKSSKYYNQFYLEIEWMNAKGITTGMGDGTYAPKAPVTREAMAAFLYRMAGSPSYTPPSTPSFPDVSNVKTAASYNQFYKEIEWMNAKAITTGMADGTYAPKGDVTREAMAAFMWRMSNQKLYCSKYTKGIDCPA